MKFKKTHFIVLLILILNFIFRLLIFFKTKLFYFHDWRGYLDGIEKIRQTGSIPLVNGNFFYLLSYIGYFFKYCLGDIKYFFIFNALIGTLISLVVYNVVLKITNNKKSAILSILLHLIYTEFIVWSSIFYSPIIMMFLLSLIIFLLLIFLNYKDNKHPLIIGLLIILLINFSFYFKNEMKYFYLIFFIFAIFLKKNKYIFQRFLLLSIMLYSVTFIANKAHILPYKKGNVMANDFIFFGHTLYGGDGGDGSFIYQENKDRYFKEFRKYCEINNIPDSLKSNQKIINKFQLNEIKKFITKHPFLWIKLQGYKFFRFFGIVPEGDSSKILISGLFKGKMYLTAIFLIIPFSFLMILFILSIDFRNILIKLHNPRNFLIFIIALYYLVASVFYGQYQERYRMPLFVIFIIPFIAINITKIRINKKYFKSRIINFVILFIFFIAWANQIYFILHTQKDRYLKTIQRVKQMPKTNLKWKDYVK